MLLEITYNGKLLLHTKNLVLVCWMSKYKPITRNHLSREVFYSVKWFAQGEDVLMEMFYLKLDIEGKDGFSPGALFWPCQHVTSSTKYKHDSLV